MLQLPGKIVLVWLTHTPNFLPAGLQILPAAVLRRLITCQLPKSACTSWHCTAHTFAEAHRKVTLKGKGGKVGARVFRITSSSRGFIRSLVRPRLINRCQTLLALLRPTGKRHILRSEIIQKLLLRFGFVRLPRTRHFGSGKILRPFCKAELFHFWQEERCQLAGATHRCRPI